MSDSILFVGGQLGSRYPQTKKIGIALCKLFLCIEADLLQAAVRLVLSRGVCRLFGGKAENELAESIKGTIPPLCQQDSQMIGEFDR